MCIRTTAEIFPTKHAEGLSAVVLKLGKSSKFMLAAGVATQVRT